MDGIQNPQNGFMQGIQAYQVGANIAEQQRQRQLAEQQRQRAEQYKQQFASIVSNPAATADDYMNLQAQYPEQSQAIKDMMGQKSKEELDSDTLAIQQMYYAANNKNWDVFNQFADERIEALRNSGREQEAKGLEALKANADIVPEAVPGGLMSTLSALMGPEEFRKFYREQQTAAAKTTEGLKGRFQPSTEKGPDGTIWAMNDKGEVTVKDITGKVLEGEEAKKAWLKSKEYGVDIANRTNFARETGKLTAQKGTKAEIEEEVTRGKEKAKGEEGRAQSLIERGSLAAESTAGLRRGIQLLDQVKTGGPRAVALRVKQLFGIETADEGELSNQLSKAVLSQLRETFGAAFTENEGRRLERIEASFTKSPATNKRLLQQSLQIAERTAKRAREAARKRGDMETVNDIDNLLEFSLSEEQQGPIQVEQGERTATNPQTGQKLVFRNNQWIDINTGNPI